MNPLSHPSIKAYQNQAAAPDPTPANAAVLKEIARKAGAVDAGLIDLDRDPVLPHKADLLGVMHDTQSLMVIALKLDRTPLRSLSHSVADQEFKQVMDQAKIVQKNIVEALSSQGIKAVSMPVGFPMEMKRWPAQVWLTNEKLFAQEAGLGSMGYNRLLLHPVHGAAVLLGTLLLATDCDAYDRPLETDPCLGCGLCAKVCPTGAIKPQGGFDFTSCYSHNYRERIGGFLNWLEQVVESKTTAEYRSRVSDGETFSMWQNLAMGSQTRCDRCMAVCPAGEAAVGEFAQDPKAYVHHYQKPFAQLAETIYAVKGSDAEAHVKAHFPHKTIKPISNGLRPLTVEMFLSSLPRIFQAGQSHGIDTVYHFTFTGQETATATVTIRNQTLTVQDGLQGQSDLAVTADSRTWLNFLAGEANLLLALVTRKIRIKGSPKLMKNFARCFPS